MTTGYNHEEFGCVIQTIDMQEWTSGVGQIVSVDAERGHTTSGFEIDVDEMNRDFLVCVGGGRTHGLMLAVKEGNYLRLGGLHQWNTVCISWVCVHVCVQLLLLLLLLPLLLRLLLLLLLQLVLLLLLLLLLLPLLLLLLRIAWPQE